MEADEVVLNIGSRAGVGVGQRFAAAGGEALVEALCVDPGTCRGGIRTGRALLREGLRVQEEGHTK